MTVSENFDGFAQTQPCIRIRFCEETDLTRIFNFYSEYQHEHVDLRAEDLLRGSVTTRRVFLVEQPHDVIAMASSAYDYHDPRHDQTNKSWVEIGSTRAPVAGLGLYPFTIAAQVVHEFFTRPPEEFFFASIYNNNEAVAAMLSGKVGWEFFEPEETLIDVSGERENMGKLTWLRADTTTLPHQARLVLETIERFELAGVTSKKTGEHFAVDLSDFPLANELRPKLQELAHGGCGRLTENNAPTNMRILREMLDKAMASCLPAPQHKI